MIDSVAKEKSPTVNVLLSTYNGEKYLREQIDSILAQKGVRPILYIRDDGSQDGTVDIINDYMSRYDNIKLHVGKNAGVGKSFLSLLKNVPKADYYAFADQDDVWLDDKLERAVQIIKCAEKKNLADFAGKGNLLDAEIIPECEEGDGKEVPILYGSNQNLVDSELNKIGVREVDTNRCDFYNCISRNQIYGCTMVMNNALRDECCKAPLPCNRVLSRKNHDAWVLYCAFILGVFIFDKESRMLYRQHAGNVVGGIRAKGFSLIKEKIERLKKQKNKKIRSLLANDLLTSFGDRMNEQIIQRMTLLKNVNSFKGVLKMCRDEVMVNSFKEKKVFIILRGMLGWI